MPALASSRRRRGAALGAGAAIVLTTLAGCTDGAVRSVSAGGGEQGEQDGAGEAFDFPEPSDAARRAAVSRTREDSVYPEVGDPGVDALHYDLDLAWDPDTQVLEGRQRLELRATRDAEQLRLDLIPELEVSAARLDGEDVPTSHDGKDLVVEAPVARDDEHVLELEYAGTPAKVEAPSRRADFDGLGFTISDDGAAWTMQEPFGAHTWYAVNDQPADKALYDFTLTVPEPMTGVANGELLETTEADGLRTTRWHLAEPASSYLTTVAFDEYETTELTSGSGVPISLWIPADQPELTAGPATAPDAMDWLEEILGPYPFDTFGIVVVDSESGMETQTMVTLGDTAYSTSAPVVVHELAHHWYGDQVSPNDWRDVWMNEGMAMYLQGMWEAEQGGVEVDAVLDTWAPGERLERRDAGPPADYDPADFGSGNIYYGPALMWHELRQQLGDDRFFAMVRAWPAARDNRATGRGDYLAWIERETGEELSVFFDAWLLGERTPPRS